jgi:hypothetical protein
MGGKLAVKADARPEGKMLQQTDITIIAMLRLQV